MQNEEKTKNKLPYKKLKSIKKEEDKNWKNLPEIDLKKEKWSLLPHEIKNMLKNDYRGSKGKNKMTLRTKIEIFVLTTVVLTIFLYIVYQLLSLRMIYKMNPSNYLYTTQCGHIPLEEQGENCSILRAKVLEAKK